MKLITYILIFDLMLLMNKKSVKVKNPETQASLLKTHLQKHFTNNLPEVL